MHTSQFRDIKKDRIFLTNIMSDEELINSLTNWIERVKKLMITTAMST